MKWRRAEKCGRRQFYVWVCVSELSVVDFRRCLLESALQHFRPCLASDLHLVWITALVVDWEENHLGNLHLPSAKNTGNTPKYRIRAAFNRTRLYSVWNAVTPAIWKTCIDLYKLFHVFCSISFEIVSTVLDYVYILPYVYLVPNSIHLLDIYSLIVEKLEIYIKKTKNKTPIGSGFWPQSAAERPNSCAAQGSRP